MTRDVTLGTMNLVTFDVVSVPSKITSAMLATIKHKTSCKPTLFLPSVRMYLFNTFCRVKFINSVSCGSWLKRTERKKHKLTGILLPALQSGVRNNRLSQRPLSANRKETAFGATA